MTDRSQSGVLPSEENPLRRRAGCPDLDPNWLDIFGNPRGPRVCTLYPNCECGNEDRAMTDSSEKRQVSSKERPLRLSNDRLEQCREYLTGWNGQPGSYMDDIKLALTELSERRSSETNELLSIAQKVEPGELEQLRRIDQAARKFVEKAESRGEWKSYPEWGELNTAIFDGSPTQKASEGRS